MPSINSQTSQSNHNSLLRQQLDQYLVQLQLPLSTEVREKLLAYIALLHKWNNISNLTAIRQPQRMLTHHILDSLAVVSYLHGPTVLDVGTGAGLPGIPLSLTRPDWQFVLLDSKQKKLRFVRQASLELGLTNVEVACTRLQQYTQKGNFATVIARAFAPLPKLIPACLPFCTEQGQIIAMLGERPEQELIPPTGWEYVILPLQVPGLEGQRHVLKLSRLN